LDSLASLARTTKHTRNEQVIVKKIDMQEHAAPISEIGYSFLKIMFGFHNYIEVFPIQKPEQK